jgi:hypothetical protein
MTEAEWLACDDPGPMLAFLTGRAANPWRWPRQRGRLPPRLKLLGGRPGDRKFRLCACFCARLLEPLPPGHPVAEGANAEFQAAIAMAEAVADGLASGRDLAKYPNYGVTLKPAYLAAICSAGDGSLRARRPVVASLLRCVFGNPFRPAALDPAWLTVSVTALARAAYDERHLPSGHLDQQRLAVLADAVEEADCSDDEILVHLRGPGPHVRGCFAVDLLLGKA